jgi:hypothetical protein
VLGHPGDSRFARKEGEIEREERAIFWRDAVSKGTESERDCRGEGDRARSRLCGGNRRRLEKALTMGSHLSGGERGDGYRFGFHSWAATVGPD